jgi:GNAT superfamily N-acetyltransferase
VYYPKNETVNVKKHSKVFLCFVYFESELIGFITFCMDHISKHRLTFKDRLVKPVSSYPGLLIGQLGVAEKYQHKGIGKYMRDFCFDRALRLSQKSSRLQIFNCKRFRNCSRLLRQL